MLSRSILGLLLGSSVFIGTAKATTFPLKISSDGHYLVDALNQPFLYHAETGWTMVARLTPADAEQYMETRRQQGFTALQVMAVDMYNLKTKAGEPPFTEDRNPLKPNEKYFQHLDWILKTARDKGLFIMLAPLWLGGGCTDWYKYYTPENAAGFGRFLGERYKGQDNLMWLLGGDCDPRDKIESIRAMGNAIKKAAPAQFQAYHAGSGSGSAKFFHTDAWNTVSSAYTYKEVNPAVLSDYKLMPPKPTILTESGYESESNDGRGGEPHRLRRQAYGAMLSGAAGHAFGSKSIWSFSADWKTWLNKPGVTQMIHLKNLLTARKWQDLVPDASHTLLTTEFEGNGFFVGTALAKDGAFALIYSPWPHTLKVDMGKLKGPVKAQWYDPTNGSYTSASGATATLPNTGSRDFVMPAKNSAGDGDFVLVLESGSTVSLISRDGKPLSRSQTQDRGVDAEWKDALGRGLISAPEAFRAPKFETSRQGGSSKTPTIGESIP